MTDTYELIRNLLQISLNDDFPKEHTKPAVSRQPSSCFSTKSLSSEKLSEDTFSWPYDTWSDNMPKKPQNPFRSDRSMSLTDNYLPNFFNNKMKSLDLPPPPGFPPLAPQPSNRYKTELCRSFQENGSCKYGNKCQFAHGESELRGLYRHPKYKTEACRTFYNFGYCPYGSRCHFIHEEKLSSPQTLNQKSQAPASQQARVLRQSVSFAGFLGSRSVSPPISHESMGFSRAPSVSPPPTDVLSPAFNDTSRDMFPFPQIRVDSDVHNQPLLIEPQKSSHCVWGQETNFEPLASKCVVKEKRSSAFGFSHGSIQRFASDDSLSDHESYSSTGSTSGSESPTFESAASKRLTVFTRMSVSE
ncbi:mRNA decay activator protein ZFP36 [Tachysurus fulvidraco]|uniref:mRNA decay activator protein ZFP36-like n=1 Tax=Tachysurus fulvidraco TaxID=1234273 RepID=UPI000F4E1B08|nr:mRNA decay activator protein ZFP36-like [Tachysurus fulvidraco]XP_047676715.1 mRNA decay activator protein ZFP36 [Tachysurus fulvidraco]